MEKYLTRKSSEWNNVPDDVRKQAKEGKRVLMILWDKEGGYPEHAWGYVQYTIRPYVQGYGCDGTTDLNIHLIAMILCEKLGLDYIALYAQAYADRDFDLDWLRHIDWDPIRKETILPGQVNDLTLRLLLHDLNDINNRSICDLLEEKFEGLGYNVTEWWNVKEKLMEE